MHRSRALVVAGSLVVATGLLLPFVTLSPLGGIGGVSADAWPTAALAGLAALAALAGDRGDVPARPVAFAVAIPAAAAVAFAVAKIIDAGRATSEAGGAIGSGAWVMLTGAVLAAVGAALSFGRRI